MSEVLLYCRDVSNLPFVSVLRTAASCCQVPLLEGFVVSNNFKDIILQRLCEDESLVPMVSVPSCARMALHQLNREASTTQKNDWDLGKREMIIACFRGCVWDGKK